MLTPDWLMNPQTETPPPTSAQAVLHSFWDAPVSPARNFQIAAALRAVANQPQEVPVHVQDESYWPYVNGIEQMQEFLERLAAELEAIN